MWHDNRPAPQTAERRHIMAPHRLHAMPEAHEVRWGTVLHVSSSGGSLRMRCRTRGDARPRCASQA
eukprot:11846241-Alexandrium_andersonii.AAC.1